MATAPRSRAREWSGTPRCPRCDPCANVAQRFIQGTRSGFHGTGRGGIITRTVLLKPRLLGVLKCTMSETETFFLSARQLVRAPRDVSETVARYGTDTTTKASGPDGLG